MVWGTRSGPQAAAELISNDPFDGLEDTPENRRRTALSALRQWYETLEKKP
ncbi:hypothetical protein SAMN04488591_0370 [Microbacterium azadirachtae]|uniref:Uncharacterized protein n=1 Tax=Microbacterium azadirachtae TaxID=582680 RepID=A0A1I6FV34_9MICO|nr:hypothetical protein SAMN04488591_0370 [Microbacterium azadirachtae]